jgi:thiamine monophosphate kinase
MTEFLYRNPHSFVKVEAKDDKGNPVTWAVEWGGGAQLTQDHVNRDTLRPGDVVVITGNPGRDPAEHRIRVHKIVRPKDGWKWEGVVM